MNIVRTGFRQEMSFAYNGSYRAFSRQAKSSAESCKWTTGHPSMASWSGGWGILNMSENTVECIERVLRCTRNNVVCTLRTTDPSSNQNSEWRVELAIDASAELLSTSVRARFRGFDMGWAERSQMCSCSDEWQPISSLSLAYHPALHVIARRRSLRIIHWTSYLLSMQESPDDCFSLAKSLSYIIPHHFNRGSTQFSRRANNELFSNDRAKHIDRVIFDVIVWNSYSTNFTPTKRYTSCWLRSGKYNLKFHDHSN